MEWNVVVTVDQEFERAEKELEALGPVARVEPAQHVFSFQSREEFEEKAGEVLREIAPELAGRSFHIRMHRRGFGDELSSGEEERELAAVVYDTLEEAGLAEPSVTFEDPDAVIAIETVSNRAGVSLWTRTDLEAHPILNPD